MGNELNQFIDLLEAPQQASPIQLIDSLVKEGMTTTYNKLMYIKDSFRNEPKNFNPNEMNLKILFKEKYEKDNKLRIAEEEEEDDTTDDQYDPFPKLNDSKLHANENVNKHESTLNISGADSPIKQRDIQSMKEYIMNFCKRYNINLKFDKFPIQLFLDQPMNAAFINYKKRKLFFEVVNTVESMIKQMQDEKEAEELAKLKALAAA